MKLQLVYFWRFLAMCLAVTAAAVMLEAKTDEQSEWCYAATYLNWPSFVCFVVVTFIIGAHDLAMLCLPKASLLERLVVMFDSVMAMLLVGTCAAAMDTYVKLRNGVPEAKWSPQCSTMPHFCKFVLIALVLGCLKMVLSSAIVLYSLHVVVNPLLKS